MTSPTYGSDAKFSCHKDRISMSSGNAREAAGRNYQDRWYNGFSPDERALLSKPQKAERYSRGRNPTACCMTGFSRPNDLKRTGYLFTHLEDYRKPLHWYPMSKRAHMLLHRRFVEPEKWIRYVAKHYVHGAWFTLLTMNADDMYKPFDVIYPNGLPTMKECWQEYADFVGVTRQSFSDCCCAHTIPNGSR